MSDVVNSQKVPFIYYPNRCRLCRTEIKSNETFCEACKVESGSSVLDVLR